MQDKDWDQLCSNIYENKCILFIGSEFPVEIVGEDNTKTESTFSKLLYGKIFEEIREIKRLEYQKDEDEDDEDLVNERLSRYMQKNHANRELSELANDFFKRNTDKNNNLYAKLADYLFSANHFLESEYFTKLIRLPFTVLINTNYDNFFYKKLKEVKSETRQDYYNYKGDKKELVLTETEDIASEEQPFVYNLFGSVNKPASMAVNEFDLIQLLSNIISNNPGLPKNLRSVLADAENCFLFLGFGVIAKNWYFRILLYTLGSKDKKLMSYALESIQHIADDKDPTMIFFRDGLNVSLSHANQKEFIDELTRRYNAFLEKQEQKNQEEETYGHPYVFISYKGEDHTAVRDIVAKLRTHNVFPWLDKSRLTARYNDEIAEAIMQKADFFLLLESESMKNTPINYVNKEIRMAVKRGTSYPNDISFVFRGYIDNKQSIRMDFPELNELHVFNLTDEEDIKRLAKELKRAYESLNKNKVKSNAG
jgi:hypothetical protein